MSATQPSHDPTRRRSPSPQSTRHISQLHARRREARERRRLARVDLSLGVLAAIVLLILTPGLAIAALVALIVLLFCALSAVLERRS